MSEMRVCKKCGTEKLITEFEKAQKWFLWTCKTCRREYHRRIGRLYYERNKEILITKAKEWATKNKEKRSLITKRNKDLHREKYGERNRAYSKEWYYKNIEKARLKSRLSVKSISMSYVRGVLGITKKSDVPEDLLLAKKALIQINRLLKEKQ